jgi:acetylornithine aminotransferase
MTGYRSGFMAGDPALMEVLRRFRPAVGVATPDFIQSAAIAAWNDDAHPAEQRALYAAKRGVMREWMASRGLVIESSEATFYLWMKVPGGDDRAFCERLMEQGIVVMPGSDLGPGGEGYCRWALVPTLEECREAVRRLEAAAVGAK